MVAGGRHDKAVAPCPLDGKAMFDAAGEWIRWRGYADAKPSESIQKHELPGLAVAVIFPYKPSVEVLQLPVKQYKDYKPRTKGARAVQLAKWLTAEKQLGLVLKGFFLVDTQVAAAKLGIDLIQELPETRVELHYEAYRLFFGGDYVDFAQAVALEYYFFTITLGILRAGMSLKPEERRLFVAMDRFPDKGTDNAVPGQPLPPTQGAKFLEFVRQRSRTGLGIEEENRSAKLRAKLGTLDWWKLKNEEAWQKGKSHPHFVLPDWLAAAAIAHEFREEFISTFTKQEEGAEAADGLEELYQSFKTYDLWSMTGGTLPHIRAAEKLWNVPDDAREFILARAHR